MIESFKKIDFSATPCDFNFKLILIGHTGVGKTNILTKFCDNQFSENFQITIGVEYKTQIVEINDKKVELRIWDTAGQERYQSMTKLYYRSSNGVFIVYDITNPESFNKLDYWIKELKSQEQANAMFMIIGNKCDLEDKRKISKEKGEKFAKENDVLFMETSAKDGTNIEEAFEVLTKEILSVSQKKNNLTNSIILSGPNQNQNPNSNRKTKSGCC
ncbi:ras-related protein rab-8b [Anaeramoeba ignava]|uniref:Ras-related protein rab-8b n=1 Tax=Anaeramoeba ignava TaxID=1746090 RepID=A0A9Q0LRM1_ANAIG|nr:ras-related protein rab-8b [Anaeramoeba ignava]